MLWWSCLDACLKLLVAPLITMVDAASRPPLYHYMIVCSTYLGHDLYLPAHVVNTKGMSTMMFLRQCLLSLLLCSSTYLFPTFDVGNSTDPQLWIVHTIVMYSSLYPKCCRQNHYREVLRLEIFVEQELRFGLDLGQMANFPAFKFF